MIQANKPAKMSDEDWKELKAKCVSTTCLCIINNSIINVIDDNFIVIIKDK